MYWSQVDVMDDCVWVVSSHITNSNDSIWAYPTITLSVKPLSLLQKLCKRYLSTKSARCAEQEQLEARDLQGICMSIKLRRNEFIMWTKWTKTLRKHFLQSFSLQQFSLVSVTVAQSMLTQQPWIPKNSEKVTVTFIWRVCFFPPVEHTLLLCAWWDV